MSSDSILSSSEVVLVGAGLSNLEVIRKYRETTEKKFRLTLVNPEPQLIYSGMLPSLISGDKKPNECHVDLGHLCQDSGVRFVCDYVSKIDTNKNQVAVGLSHRQLNFEILSIDTGALPKKLNDTLKDLSKLQISTQPVSQFLSWLGILESELSSDKYSIEKPFNLIVVGSDPHTFELTFAIQRRFAKLSKTSGKIRIHSVQPPRINSELILEKTKAKLQKLQRRAKILIYPDITVEHFDKSTSKVTFSNGEHIACNNIILSQSGEGQKFIKESAISNSATGLVDIQKNFESTLVSGIYVVGDTISNNQKISYSKSGFYSSKMGKILAENIFRKFNGEIQLEYNKTNLPFSFIDLGSGNAFFISDKYSRHSKFMGKIKKIFDELWLEKYQTPAKKLRISTFIESGNIKNTPCAGAGATVPINTFNILKSISINSADLDKANIENDSISNVQIHKDQHLLQAGTFFRPLTKDLNLLGKITTTHCLNNIYAKRITPHSTHLFMTIPYGPKVTIKRDVKEIVSGVASCLSPINVSIAGIHSQTGPSANSGILIQGALNVGLKKTAWDYKNINPGDKIILTKPLGNGILFAGYHRYIINTKFIQHALSSMLFPHLKATEIAEQFDISFSSHVKGIGLAKKMHKLLEAIDLSANLKLEKLPIYSGVLKALALGVRSSLHTQNRLESTKSLQGLNNRELLVAEAIFDPQTCGPLLFVLPSSQALDFINSLIDSGYSNASIIGEISEKEINKHMLSLS